MVQKYVVKWVFFDAFEVTSFLVRAAFFECSTGNTKVMEMGTCVRRVVAQSFRWMPAVSPE
jgi:hypothetical protein